MQLSNQLIVVALLSVMFMHCATVSAQPNGMFTWIYQSADTNCSSPNPVMAGGQLNGQCYTDSGINYIITCSNGNAVMNIYSHSDSQCTGSAATGSGLGNGNTCFPVITSGGAIDFNVKVTCNGNSRQIMHSVFVVPGIIIMLILLVVLWY